MNKLNDMKPKILLNDLLKISALSQKLNDISHLCQSINWIIQNGVDNIRENDLNRWIYHVDDFKNNLNVLITEIYKKLNKKL